MKNHINRLYPNIYNEIINKYKLNNIFIEINNEKLSDSYKNVIYNYNSSTHIEEKTNIHDISYVSYNTFIQQQKQIILELGNKYQMIKYDSAIDIIPYFFTILKIQDFIDKSSNFLIFYKNISNIDKSKDEFIKEIKEELVYKLTGGNDNYYNKYLKYKKKYIEIKKHYYNIF